MKRILAIYLTINLVVSVCFGKIKPKDGGDKIVIKKGDTLWSLARKYYNDPTLWPTFNEYNIIDNPDLIYPGERLAIGKSLALSLASAMRQRMKRLEREREALKKKLALGKEEIEKLKAQYKKQIEDLKKQLPSDELRLKHQAEIEAMEDEILSLQDEITKLRKEKAGLDVSLSARIVELSEKQKEIKRREDDIKLLEEKLQSRDEEIAMLKASINELSEKLTIQEGEIEKRDKRIERLEYERSIFTDLAHFLIFALVSGIFALNVIN